MDDGARVPCREGKGEIAERAGGRVVGRCSQAGWTMGNTMKKGPVACERGEQVVMTLRRGSESEGCDVGLENRRL